MIDNNVLPSGNLKRPDFTSANVSQPEAHVPQDYVIRAATELTLRNADAIPGRALAGNRHERLSHAQAALEEDCAREAKHYDARTGRFNGLSQAARDRGVASSAVVIL